MRTGLAAALLGCAGLALAQQPPAPPPGEGWDGRLPPAQFPAQQPPPPQQQPPQGDANRYGAGYGAPILILPPLRYGVPLCPDRAPPYFAGGFKPRGPYTAWHGSALPLAPATPYGYGPRDPYAPDPRDCAPAQSWNGDEGRARQFYFPPHSRH